MALALVLLLELADFFSTEPLWQQPLFEWWNLSSWFYQDWIPLPMFHWFLWKTV